MPTQQLDTLAARLAFAMKTRQLTQRGTADLVTEQSGVKLSQVAIQKIQSGATLNPKRLPDIARALGVATDWLAYGSPDGKTPASLNNLDAKDASGGIEEQDGRKLRRGAVPVTGTAQLGLDGYFESDGAQGGKANGYIAIFSDDPDAYALRVTGDSMSPRIRHGEFVVIEPGRQLIQQEECLVQLADGRKMIKIFVYLRDGFYRLDSVNHDFAPLHVAAQDVEAVHYVAGIMKGSRYFEP
jgi:phage repressor protein C with HTH and peptisase S24 domain